VKVDNGRICGGYCSIGWKSSGGYQNDNNSFVFSLDLLKKYNASQQGQSGHLYWQSNWGPLFGKGSLNLFNSPMNKANQAYCRIETECLTVPGDSQGKSELTGTKVNFTCAELEVF
jgi:hypothetical protein